MSELQIKLSFVPGLDEVVSSEIEKYSELKIIGRDKDSFYIEYISDFLELKKIRSVSKIYLVSRDSKFNPIYISKHKSVLGNLIHEIVEKNPNKSFKTFRIYCAGKNTPEISAITKYVENDFNLVSAEDADMKIHIAKINNNWEVGVQITPRPFSLREYKEKNMSGAMDPTIAHSLNSLCDLDNCSSYLNIFSGSGTLLIEAALAYKNLEKIIGFDNNKERLSISVQNIKKAGLIQKIQFKEADIYDNPDLGKFDVITSDLPFGMTISKNEDLEKLYKIFLKYSGEHLNEGGILAVYTSEFQLFEKLVPDSHFYIKKEVKVKLITSEEQYLPVKMIILQK